MKEQVLDAMDLEREKGITIKSHAIAMEYVAQDGQVYQLNLIDTPGHVDFTYEVSRSLAACEGAMLVVDASQGIEAQTLSNFFLALEHGLTIVPAINKIDLPAARPDEVALELAHLTGEPARQCSRVSAKTGSASTTCSSRWSRACRRPRTTPQAAASADLRLGVRPVPGRGRRRAGGRRAGQGRRCDPVPCPTAGVVYEVLRGRPVPAAPHPDPGTAAGEVGYMVAGVKDVAEARVGDTVLAADRPSPVAAAGLPRVKPMVFSGLYPIDPSSTRT